MISPFRAFAALAFLFAAAGPAAAGGALATVGSETITEEYLLAAKAELSRVGMPGLDEERLLRHLTEQKLTAQVSRNRYPGRNEEIRGELERKRRVFLARLYEELRVTGLAGAPSDEELERAYRPSPRYDVARLAFNSGAAVEEFLREYRDRLEEYGGPYNRMDFTGIIVPHKSVPPALEEALPGMKAGEWFGPLERGGNHFIFLLTAVASPDAETVAREKENLRRSLQAQGVADRQRVELSSLKEKYRFREDRDLVGRLFNRQVSLASLADETVLTSYSDREVRVSDLKAELAAYQSRSSHDILSRRTVGKIYVTFVTESLYEVAALGLGLHETPEGAAHLEYVKDLVWARVLAEEIAKELGPPTENELREYYGEHRDQNPLSFDEERVAVSRKLQAERKMNRFREIVDSERGKFPVTIAAPPTAVGR